MAMRTVKISINIFIHLIGIF